MTIQIKPHFRCQFTNNVEERVTQGVTLRQRCNTRTYTYLSGYPLTAIVLEQILVTECKDDTDIKISLVA